MQIQIVSRLGLHGNIFKRTRLTREQIVNVLGSYANKNKSTIGLRRYDMWICAETNCKHTRLVWEPFLSILGLQIVSVQGDAATYWC
jgi:hypothetical protein